MADHAHISLADIHAPPDHPRRKWHDNHRAAGYHLQEWIIPKPNDPIFGSYTCEGHGGSVEVTYLESGPTGAPELHVQWADGLAFTVLDETVATQYLVLCNAQRA